MKLRLTLLALLAAVTLAQDRPQVILLADGSQIFGIVVKDECTDDVIVIRDRRTGGKRTVAWDKLEAKTARRIRIDLGFETADVEDSLRVQGHEIRTRAGKVFLGLLLNEKTSLQDGFYHLKTAERDYKIPVRDVPEPPEAIELTADAVYTPTELYDRKVAEAPPVTAVDHFRIADYARKIGALEAAKRHFEKLLALGDKRYSAERIGRYLDLVNKLLSAREAREELRSIKQAIVYNRFDQAAQLIEEFRAKHKDDEMLLSNLAELEEEGKQRKEEHHVAHVSRRLPKLVKDILSRKLRDEQDLGLREAMRYAGGQATTKDGVTAHALEKIAEELGVEPKGVVALWEKRPKRTIRLGFFRDGTFIVVENIEDPMAKAPKAKQPPKTKSGKIALPTPRAQLTPERWWEIKRQAKKNRDLRDFLFAYWAQESQMCEVLGPKRVTCPTCNGKGYVMQVVTTTAGSIPYAERCGTCHCALHFRIVRWR
jgi:tetratricopeptide (TPR) repeat protein